MTENLDLTQLREVAEKATPGPWEKRELPVPVSNSTCTIHAPNAVGIPTWSPLPPEIAGILKHEDATHIATFSPPTVLALIERVQATEAAVQRVRESHSEYVISEWDDETNSPKLSENGERVVLARLCRECSSDDAIESAGDGEWYEGEYHEVHYPCPTIHALDGGDQK